MKYLLIAFMIILTACGDSEQEKLRKQEQALEQQQQQLFQNQQQLQQQIQQQQYQQPQQGYSPQQPVIVQQPATQQAPVVVQQHDNTMSNMLLGGLIGHAIGSSGNSSNYHPAPSYGYNQPRNVTNVTRNVTINQAPSSKPSSARLPSSMKSGSSSRRR